MGWSPGCMALPVDAPAHRPFLVYSPEATAFWEGRRHCGCQVQGGWVPAGREQRSLRMLL